MPEYELRASDGRGITVSFPRSLSDAELSKLSQARAKAWGLDADKVSAKPRDRLKLEGTFPGDMPWSDTVRQWGKDRPGFLGDIVRGVIPMTPAQTGADVATLPLTGVGGRMAGGALRAGASALGAAAGEWLGGGEHPGQAAILHGAPTAITEGALGAAERVIAPRLSAMSRHGTLNPREAGRLEQHAVQQGRSGAERTAREQTRALEQAAEAAAKTQTAQAKVGAQATRDTAEQMRVGTRQKDIAHGMSRVIPELEADAQELYGAAFSWGKPQLDRVFDAALDGVKKRIGNERVFQIPELRNGAKLSFDEARTELAELGTGIGQQGRTVRSANQSYTAVDYRNARDELQAQLNAVDMRMHPMHRFMPNVSWAGDVWDDAMKARSAGRAYLGLLQKAIDPKSGALDPDKLRTLVNKNVEKLRERFGRSWDQAESALLGGQRVPAQVSGPLKTPKVDPTQPAAVTPVQPQYPPARQPFRFSPATTAAADVAAQDPLIGGAEMGMAQAVPSMLYRFGHRLLAP